MMLCRLRTALLLGILLWLTGCATTGSPDDCTANTQNLPDCPPLEAIEDPYITSLYWQRAWQPTTS